MIVEQAIFTSERSSRRPGYQLVASSGGVPDIDQRELSIWGPSHDSLFSTGLKRSLNFHALPSGAFCVSRTLLAGAEYSGRRGPRVYTHSLIVSREQLARFANNPFALHYAAASQGGLRVYEHVPKRIEPLEMAGGAELVDTAFVQETAVRVGVSRLAAFVDAALSHNPLGLAAGDEGPRLVAALVNCLPLNCRLEFSFTTNLKFSPRRPFRVLCLPDDPVERRRFGRQTTGGMFSLDSDPRRPSSDPVGWGQVVAEAIERGDLGQFATRLDELGHALCAAELAVVQRNAAGGLSAERPSAGSVGRQLLGI